MRVVVAVHISRGGRQDLYYNTVRSPGGGEAWMSSSIRPVRRGLFSLHQSHYLVCDEFGGMMTEIVVQ
jgi:hypothetical protein